MRLPLADLRDLRVADLRSDLLAALAVTLLAVPQGLAYAMIAGVPPVAGLAASTLPTIVGSLTRSSRHVIAGPSNALSLLVGGSLAALSADPLQAAMTLALMVGLLQVLAGVLRLGPVIDFLSGPVILGYVTGAGVLIGVGQLGAGLGISVPRGSLLGQLSSVVNQVSQVHLPSLGLAVVTAAVLAGTRRWRPDWPAAVVAVGAGVALSVALDLPSAGVRVLGDVSVIPAGLPALTLPDLSLVSELWPAALACCLLSLVESSAVAGNLSRETRQRVDADAEFVGQGLANLSAAFVGGFPTSGSLARSALNQRLGAKTRLAGVMAGCLMLAVMVWLGPVVERIPVPVLAGMLWMVAAGLVDLSRLSATWRGRLGDRAALLATLIGTWVLPLDRAIALGVFISIVLFLRRVRMLKTVELDFTAHGAVVELATDASPAEARPVRVLHVEGPLFFGSSAALRRALEALLHEPDVKVVVVRLKRTQALDVTAGRVLADVAVRARSERQAVLFAGVSADDVALLRRAGLLSRIGEDAVFEGEAQTFVALRRAVEAGLGLAGVAVDQSGLLGAWLTAEAEGADRDPPGPAEAG